MAASVDTPSPAHLIKESTSLMGMGGSSSSSSPLFSPSSDKRFWSNLRSRVDTLLENRNCEIPNLDSSVHPLMRNRGSDRTKQLKEDSLLLLRGFDSITNSLSLLSNNLDNALQGAKDLAKPPTMTEIFQNNLNNSKSKEEENLEKKESEEEASKTALKRKFDDSNECSENQEEDSSKENEQKSRKDGKLKKAKNLAMSMATKAASLARELKSIRSDLSFMQERCSLLEEENRRLRDGFSKGIRPEEDDLVRLQLEALLSEKSRLANENANLVRENQCLNQLVEYHQVTSQDLSASYEQIIGGMCLDFSSPTPSTIPEEDIHAGNDNDVDEEAPQTPRGNLFGFSETPDDRFYV